LKLKFQTVAEKTAKNFRGLLYFAAPGTLAAAAETYQNTENSDNSDDKKIMIRLKGTQCKQSN